MKKRQETYEKARAKNPERWSKVLEIGHYPNMLSLNPIKEEELKKYVNE